MSSSVAKSAAEGKPGVLKDAVSCFEVDVLVSFMSVFGVVVIAVVVVVVVVVGRKGLPLLNPVVSQYNSTLEFLAVMYIK